VRGTGGSAGRPSGRTPSKGPTAKRLDLQGVRAVAVLLVALNHARVPGLGGGYVGVDVFFVLSGYFITGLLLREGFGRDRDVFGRISIRGFYARRARRILPAACLTLLATSIAVYVVYDVMRSDFLATKPVLEDGLAASLFFANIHFAASATNYFAQAATTMPSPFQHFWSLSVEEQFYVVWPTVLAVAFFVCRRRRGHDGEAVEDRRRAATWVVGGLIALGCAASLIWSIHDTAADPKVAYFNTPARVWEFGLGAALALHAARWGSRRLPRVPLLLLGWLGLAMIGCAAVTYSGTTGFPGDAALLPDLGTALIILAGMAPARASVNRLLGVKLLAYIGDRSYAFYLWHFPVLIITWQAAGRVLPVGANLLLLAGAFLLSTVTYSVYENPLRFARWLRGWRTAVMVPASMSLSVAAALVTIAFFDSSLAAQASIAERVHVPVLSAQRSQPRPRSLSRSTPIQQVALAVRSVRRGAPLPQAIVPSMQQLERENSYIGYAMPKGCQPLFGNHATGRICRLGDATAKYLVAVVGDSHAGMWMPALEADGRAQRFAVVPLDKPGCILTVIHTNLKGWPCGRWYQWALKEDHALHPVATIVAFQFTTALLSRPQVTTTELRSVLQQVRHAVLLADPPGQSQQPATCISSRHANMRRCSSRVPATYRPLMRAIGRMAARTGHPAIPTLQWFCAKGICPMVIDHTLTLRDESHLTMQYSTELGPVLGSELRPILSRLERG